MFVAEELSGVPVAVHHFSGGPVRPTTSSGRHVKCEAFSGRPVLSFWSNVLGRENKLCNFGQTARFKNKRCRNNRRGSVEHSGS